MLSRIERIVARVLVRTTYKCMECGKEQAGEGRELPFDVQSPAEIQRFVDGMRPAPHAMPVGWASYGSEHYRCGDCSV